MKLIEVKAMADATPLGKPVRIDSSQPIGGIHHLDRRAEHPGNETYMQKEACEIGSTFHKHDDEASASALLATASLTPQFYRGKDIKCADCAGCLSGKENGIFRHRAYAFS